MDGPMAQIVQDEYQFILQHHRQTVSAKYTGIIKKVLARGRPQGPNCLPFFIWPTPGRPLWTSPWCSRSM